MVASGETDDDNIELKNQINPNVISIITKMKLMQLVPKKPNYSAFDHYLTFDPSQQQQQEEEDVNDIENVDVMKKKKKNLKKNKN